MKPRTLRRFSACVVSATLISLPASQVFAQEGARALEEIVVTAAYREQGLQDVPVSISAVTGDMMAQAAIQKAEDIQFLVPNFTLTETGIAKGESLLKVDNLYDPSNIEILFFHHHIDHLHLRMFEKRPIADFL